jgi:GTP-binding protein HflX
VLVTDTVGFIQRLPTDLVAAFRATLEEIKDSTLLLHVVDISSPLAGAQVAAVEAVLKVGLYRLNPVDPYSLKAPGFKP